jgi:hypothetical protein
MCFRASGHLQQACALLRTAAHHVMMPAICETSGSTCVALAVFNSFAESQNLRCTAIYQSEHLRQSLHWHLLSTDIIGQV